jgi:hypothetical protein
MGISASNIIIQEDPRVRTSTDTPVRTMDQIRSMVEQQVVKKSRVAEEPLIHHRESAFHADMIHSHKDK